MIMGYPSEESHNPVRYNLKYIFNRPIIITYNNYLLKIITNNKITLGIQSCATDYNDEIHTAVPDFSLHYIPKILNNTLITLLV